MPVWVLIVALTRAVTVTLAATVNVAVTVAGTVTVGVTVAVTVTRAQDRLVGRRVYCILSFLCLGRRRGRRVV